jgi:hypothetical protein
VQRREYLQIILVLGFFLSPARNLLAQDAPNKVDKTFVLNGRTVDAAVVQVNGRSYVDIESLAQIMNGVVTIEPDRIVMTMPAAGSSAPPEAASAAPPQTPPAQGLSKDFVRVSMAELAEMREWRGVLATMLTYGLAVSGAWSQDYHDRVEEGLTQATAAASTQSDQSALQLLRSEFDTLTGWAGEVFAARQALDAEKTINPNTLRNDPTLAKITNCGQFLNTMLVSAVFADDSSCH